MTVTASVDALINHLWLDGDSVGGRQVFALLDGARTPAIAGMLSDTGLEQICLFAGPLTTALRAAAPHLVHLSPNAKLTRPLLESGWSDHWLVLLRTETGVTLQQLHRHLRTLLRVRDEAGNILMFRFYDPRVLRTYLPTCAPEEATSVFGPIAEFVCPGKNPAQAITFFRRRMDVCSSIFAIEAADSAALGETSL